MGMRKPKSTTPLAARLRKSLSRADLASKASVGFCTIARCEASGQWPVRPTTRQRYLAALSLVEIDGVVLPVPTAPAGGAA